MQRLVLHFFFLGNAVRIGLDDRRHRRLTADSRIDRLLRKLAQVFAVYEGQRRVDIHVAVQEDIAVRRMVIFGMEGCEGFLRQVGNIVGVAARFDAVRRVREQVLHDPPFELRVGRREHAFHFIIYDAAVRQRRIGRFQLVMPAFLHENLFVRQHIREKDGVQIHIHQIFEIDGIPAGYGIHRLVGKGHGVQERIQRALD